MDEQWYVFVDKSGHCFEDFQTSSGTASSGDELDKIIDKEFGAETNDGERRYRDYVGAMLRAGKEFPVGDMFCFRDDLTDAGFEWGKDFYVKKVPGGGQEKRTMMLNLTSNPCDRWFNEAGIRRLAGPAMAAALLDYKEINEAKQTIISL